jgi:hypothetical protein
MMNSYSTHNHVTALEFGCCRSKKQEEAEKTNRRRTRNTRFSAIGTHRFDVVEDIVAVVDISLHSTSPFPSMKTHQHTFPLRLLGIDQGLLQTRL